MNPIRQIAEFSLRLSDEPSPPPIMESDMLGTLIAILIACIVLGVLWWAVQQLLPLIPMAEPFRTIVRVVSVLILVLFVIWIILSLLAAAGIHVPTFAHF